MGIDLFEDALKLLEECPEACDRSCYRCLRSYKNKFEHDLLDRFIGASLLRYLLFGTPPALAQERMESSTDLLYQDLSRQALDGPVFERDKLIDVPGLGEVLAPIHMRSESGNTTIVALHSPLTQDLADSRLAELKEFGLAWPVVLVDELVVRRNLPRATKQVLEGAG